MLRQPAKKQTEPKPVPRKKPVEEKILQTRLNAKREILWKQLLADHDLLLRNRIEVCHVMTCAPITIEKSTPGKQIAEILSRHHVANLLVCDKDKNLLGVVRTSAHEANPDAAAATIMTPPEYSITSKATLGAAISLLIEQGVACLPVVDQGKLSGVLTPTDLVLTLHCSLQLWFRVAQTREATEQGAEVLETTSRSMAETAGQLNQRIQQLPQEVKTVAQTGNPARLEAQVSEMASAMSQLMRQLDDARAQIREQNSQIAGLKQPSPDEATGATSRDELDRVMDQLLKSSESTKEPLSAILLADGNYHHVSREEGQTTADEHLRLLAECVASNISPRDHVARYLDDTLAIVMPGTSSAEARVLGDRVTNAAESIPGNVSSVKPRMCIVSARSGESPAELMKRAEIGFTSESPKGAEPVAVTGG